MSAADARLFHRLVGARSAPADHAFWGASKAADRSFLWFASATLLATFGGAHGRRAAARGLLSIGLASGVVNGPLKLASRRRRPQVRPHVPTRGLLRTPKSSSFPSGHTASAFAFGTAVGAEYPVIAVPLAAIVAAVGYSRIHTGVHYPGDVVAGAAVGVAAGVAADRLLPPRRHRSHVESGGHDVPRRAVLLTSPHAGSAGRLGRARRAMIDDGIEILEEVPVHDHARLADWVTRTPVTIVAAGGDGTVGAAADHVANTDAVLAVLPLGTSNDFARSIGVPIDPVEAAHLLVTGKVSSIDAGRLVVPGEIQRHFVHAATVGLNVSFAKLATRASMRRRFGRLTYAVAAAVALRDQQNFYCELRYDGQVERLNLAHLAVINAPVFGGFLGMRVGDASVNDRKLDVIAVERLPVRRLLLAAAYPIIGSKRAIRGIRTLQLPQLHAHTRQPLEVALDGEIVGTVPADFEVAGEGLKVVTPVDFEDASG